MIQFYLPQIDDEVLLPQEESAHCVRVLRKKIGDQVTCVDGKGYRYNCEIIEDHPKKVLLKVLSKTKVEKSWHNRIILAVAPTKNIDRIEWLIEKCTEMGIDEIWLIRCSRSERKNVKQERLEKIIVSAMKQSLKAAMPALRELTDFNDAIRQINADQKFICYCDKELERKDFCKQLCHGSDVAILIGPEGDFSADEVANAMISGWVPVTLGDSRLRTETAGMFAVAAVHAINQR